MNAEQLQRFLGRVDSTPGPDACWPWRGTVHHVTGYGHFTVGRRTHMAHRLAYELFHEPIPAGMQLDHLCRVRSCVNPAHLEPVTARENNRRAPLGISTINAAKTHCPQGHPLSGDNLYMKPQGWRVCRTCKAAQRNAARSRQNKAGAA
jgi:hypothetical protein